MSYNYTGGQSNYSAERRAKSLQEKMDRQVAKHARDKADREAREARQADYRRKVQEGYDQIHANGAAAWENQRQMDAQHANGANNSYTSSTGSSGGGGIIILFGGTVAVLFILWVAVITAPIGAAAGAGKVANKAMAGKGLGKRVAATALAGLGALAGTAALYKEYLPEFHEQQIQIITGQAGNKEEAPSAPVVVPEPTETVDQTAEEVDHRWSQDPCKIWADANPTLAAELQPGDRCWGF